MGVGLLVAAVAAYAAALGPAAGMHRDLLLVLAGVVVVGTGATLVGAGWLAGSAVRPVAELTEQATRIEAGTLDQRIAAHADTEEYRELVSGWSGASRHSGASRLTWDTNCVPPSLPCRGLSRWRSVPTARHKSTAACCGACSKKPKG